MPAQVSKPCVYTFKHPFYVPVGVSSPVVCFLDSKFLTGESTVSPVSLCVVPTWAFVCIEAEVRAENDVTAESSAYQSENKMATSLRAFLALGLVKSPTVIRAASFWLARSMLIVSRSWIMWLPRLLEGLTKVFIL